jgi:hypothetical protein
VGEGPFDCDMQASIVCLALPSWCVTTATPQVFWIPCVGSFAAYCMASGITCGGDSHVVVTHFQLSTAW